MQWEGDAIELRGLGVEGKITITGFVFPVISVVLRRSGLVGASSWGAIGWSM
jgi:hypothetical protein